MSTDLKQNGRRAKAKRPQAGPLLLFAKNFVKHPGLVGWMLPSTKFVVQEVLRHANWKEARTVVEYGPGVGTFTTEVLARMRPDARLFALEVNPDFVAYLQKKIRDPRLIVLHESATSIDRVLVDFGVHEADCVLSGIPFKTIKDPLRREIVHKTHKVLRKGGVMLVYQLSTTVEPYLREAFDNVRLNVERGSLVPSRMFVCRR